VKLLALQFRTILFTHLFVSRETCILPEDNLNDDEIENDFVCQICANSLKLSIDELKLDFWDRIQSPPKDQG
jgi:hypothetical protein